LHAELDGGRIATQEARMSDGRSHGDERSATRAIVRELAPRYERDLGTAVLWGSVRAAVRDLRGSVSPEALPEMAARLAYHRLQSVMPPRA
jgi:hypothetical protein